MGTDWVFKEGKDINLLSFQQIEVSQPSVYIQIIQQQFFVVFSVISKKYLNGIVVSENTSEKYIFDFHVQF